MTPKPDEDGYVVCPDCEDEFHIDEIEDDDDECPSCGEPW